VSKRYVFSLFLNTVSEMSGARIPENLDDDDDDDDVVVVDDSAAVKTP